MPNEHYTVTIERLQGEIEIYQRQLNGLNPTAYRECVNVLRELLDWLNDHNLDFDVTSDIHTAVMGGNLMGKQIEQALQHAEGKER